MTGEAHLDAVCCDLIVDVVRSAGAARMKVMGASMLPAIRPGDELRIGRGARGDLRPGQVVLFRCNGRLIAHRICRLSGEYLQTQGDSLASLDTPVRCGDVVGRVETVVRNGHEFSTGITTLQSAMAWLLRRSDLCKKIYLRMCMPGGFIA